MNFIDKAIIVALYMCFSLRKEWKFYIDKLNSLTSRDYSEEMCSLNELESIVNEAKEIIRHLIVWVPLKSNCMQRSLTVYCYLLKKGIKVDFIVGIRVVPYSFHCWLEYKNNVIYDSPTDHIMYQSKTINLKDFLESKEKS